MADGGPVCAWTTRLFAGDPAAALEHSEAGRGLYDLNRHRHAMVRLQTQFIVSIVCRQLLQLWAKKQTSAHVRVMSALPPKANIG
jgi:hypothetical protein